MKQFNDDDISHMITNRLNEFTLQLSEHLSQTVQGAVKNTVNGKIDRMTTQLDAYIKEDMKWKKDEVQPVINWFDDYTRGKRMIMASVKWVSYIGGAVVALGGAWVIIKAFVIQQFK